MNSSNIPEEKPEWFKKHEEWEKENLPVMVEQALVRVLEKKGKEGKNLIVTTALIMGSLGVIFVGIKAILGFIGFSQIIKP